MKQDINKKLEDVLNGIDKNTINSGKKLAEQMLSGKDGEKLMNQLNNIDKNKLIAAFMNMSSSEIQSKLQNADLSRLSGLNAEELLKKLR